MPTDEEMKADTNMRYAYDVGFDEGYQVGYDDGYGDGLVEGKKEKGSEDAD